VAAVTRATAAGNFSVTRPDYFRVLCSDVRISMSAALDGEAPSLPPDVVDHHLRGCGDCRRWSEAVTGLHRGLRVRAAELEPDHTDAILAALPRRRPLVDDRVQSLRIVTLAVALIQLVAALPLLFPSDTMPGMPGMDGHLERHLGISALAMAVGLLVVAWRPERARAMLPVLAVLVVGLAWACLGDIWAGRPVPGNLVAHAADVAGLVLVWILARADGGSERARRRAVLG
jgi:predicted anti-sigma-YlaC factor YlaD